MSIGVRHALALAAAIVALAPQSAAPQPDDGQDSVSNERHRLLLERIQRVLAHDGPYSADLLEPLTALIVMYREEDDDALAAVAIGRARQVVRVNNGLHTLDQVPFIQQLIRIEEARGNHAEAWELERELLALVRRYPDDLRTVAVLRNAADRTMAVLTRYLGGRERPAQVVLGCYYKTWPKSEVGKCDAGSRKTVIQGLLADAQRSYSEAIAVLLHHGLYESEELRELELELLRGVELVRAEYDDNPLREDLPLVPGMVAATRRLEPWRSRTAPIMDLADWDLPHLASTWPEIDYAANLEANHQRIDNTYDRGRQSLRRLYTYGAASESSPLRQATAVVDLADWELLYSHNGYAIDGYVLAFEMLRNARVPEAAITQLFTPQVPVVLPAFEPNPLASKGNGRTPARYIDVAFRITKYGRGRDVELVDATMSSREERDRLVRLITTNRFRPRSTDGTFEGASRVHFRYHLPD